MAESTDPLSLLAGQDDSSSSDSEGEEERRREKKRLLTDKAYYTSTVYSSNCFIIFNYYFQDCESSEKLPPPDSLFAAFSRPPSFLTNHIDPHHINWDPLVKKADPPSPPDPEVTSKNSKYSAIPPPKDLETESEISAAPVRYSNDDPTPFSDDEDTPLVEVKTGGKRSSSTKNSLSSKKPKVETFQEKEKRKRDLGMSSRGKSYVEEEKRILRQQYDQQQWSLASRTETKLQMKVFHLMININFYSLSL